MLSSYVLFSVYNQCLYKAVVAASAEHSMRTAVKEVQALPQYEAAQGEVKCALKFLQNNVHYSFCVVGHHRRQARLHSQRLPHHSAVSVRKVLHNAYWL